MPSLSRVRDFFERFNLSQTYRQIAEQFSSRVANIGLALVKSIIIARVLTPSAKGTLALATLIAAFGTQFGNIGLQASNVYIVSRNKNNINTLFANSVIVVLIVGIGGGTLLFAFFQLVPSLAPVDGVLLLFALSLIPVQLGVLFFQNIFIGMQDYREFNVADPAQALLSLVLIIGLVLVGIIGPVPFIIVNMLTSCILLGWLTSRLYSKHLNINERITASWGLFKRSASYGFRSYIGSLAMYLTLRFDVLLVGYILGTTATGYYSLAASHILYIYTFPMAVGTVMFPKLSEIDNEQKRWQKAKKTLLGVVLISITASVVALPLANPLFPLIYGQEFQPSAEPFIWLLPGFVLLSVNTIFQQYFASQGNPLVVIISPLVGGILNITLNLYLLPRIGIIGAAIASDISYGVMLLISVVYIVWRSDSKSLTLTD